MQYLRTDLLESLDPAAFQGAQPYPWLGIENLLTDAGYERLLESLPELAQLSPVFGLVRKHGQPSHDRYALEWDEAPDVAPAWREFIAELDGPAYGNFIARMLGTRAFSLRYHWHYAPRGCSVSPHCDSPKKAGSHIFYFNADWDPSWGGETLVLDDGGRFQRRSAPGFDEFDHEIPSAASGNRSFLFGRRRNSWHGVRPLKCPEERMRKVFIVVLNRNSPMDRVRRLVGLGSRGA